MSQTLYALLVGIDDYPASPKLEGCINDVDVAEKYLHTRIKDRKKLNIRTLKNQEATRQAIVDGFKEHLSQAEKDDTVLFYFSGHGSQEVVPLELSHLERDGKLETLVCWDSRTSSRDLTNKELRYLIASVAEKNPHILIVLDCCHAGSGTRNASYAKRVRHAPVDERPRKLEEFIPEVMSYLQSTKGSVDFPEGRHILLAACADREEANEYSDEGQARGAFSYFLMNALNKNNGILSYRELFKEISSQVRSRIRNQTPRLESTHPNDLDNLPFLGGSEVIRPRDPFYTVSHNGNYWMIDGGAVHGLPRNSETPIKLALFPQSSSSEQLRKLSEAVGEATLLKVLPDRSIVEFVQEPTDFTRDTVFKGVIVALPLPSIGIYLEGDADILDKVRQIIQNIGPGGKPSLYVREEKDLTKSQYRLLAKNGQYALTSLFNDRPLLEFSVEYDQVFRTIKNLEHIARWTTTLDLSNSESQLPVNAVKLQIYRNNEEFKEAHLQLEYEYKNDRWQEPTFRLKLTNTHVDSLFCAILDIAEDYSISLPPFFPQGEISQTGGIWIKPGEEVWAGIYHGNRKISDQIPAIIPDRFLKQERTEYQDVLKLIVSTAEFDANLLCQVELSSPQVEMDGMTRALPNHLNPLNLLMAQVQSRQIGASKLSTLDDWNTSQIIVTTVRPGDVVLLDSQAAITLADDVLIQAHATLQATARLTTATSFTRDANGVVIPPILDSYTQAFQFTASRGVNPGLSVLELQVKDSQIIETVTPESPLVLLLNKPLTANEYIFPVACDGEFWLPLGKSEEREGKTKIRIERLPVPNHQLADDRTRSLGGAIRIYFHKVVYCNLGQESSYPKLRVARLIEDGTVLYVEDKQQIQLAISNAQRIVLYIHGIIGDTESILPSMRSTKVQINEQTKSIDELYDLVLTFDYESLNTPIKDLGKQLKDELNAIGLQANHDKTLHIIAHSMGGLVSRSFIEQWGGNRIVQHLIMLGTPNAGSPWAAVQDMATFILATGLNGLSSVVFPAKVLSHLVALIEKIDVNLDEMHPTKSTFLQELKDCADPKCPYSIIAGNTFLIPQQTAKMNRLQAALQKGWRRTIDLPFRQEAHDIAVTVKSIVSVPSGRSPAAYIQDQVACDHLSYFRHPAGLEALAKAVSRAHSDLSNAATSNLDLSRG